MRPSLALALSTGLFAATGSTQVLAVSLSAAQMQKHLAERGFRECGPSELLEDTRVCWRGGYPTQSYKVEMEPADGSPLRIMYIWTVPPKSLKTDWEEAFTVVASAAGFPYPGADPERLTSWLRSARKSAEQSRPSEIEIGGVCFIYVDMKGGPAIRIRPSGCRPQQRSRPTTR
jgi:hypothetical protein